jgi:hypothetical protein
MQTKEHLCLTVEVYQQERVLTVDLPFLPYKYNLTKHMKLPVTCLTVSAPTAILN